QPRRAGDRARMSAFAVVTEQVKQRHLFDVMSCFGLQREDTRTPDDLACRVMVRVKYDILGAPSDAVVAIEFWVAADLVFLFRPYVQYGRGLCTECSKLRFERRIARIAHHAAQHSPQIRVRREEVIWFGLFPCGEIAAALCIGVHRIVLIPVLARFPARPADYGSYCDAHAPSSAASCWCYAAKASRYPS